MADKQQQFNHLFGNTADFNREIKCIDSMVKIAQEKYPQDLEKWQNENLKIFLGSTSTSTVNKTCFNYHVYALKEIPLIRFLNLKTLIQINPNYRYLFEDSGDPDYHPAKYGLNLIKKMYTMFKSLGQIQKPFQQILSSYDPSKIPLNLLMKQTSNTTNFPLNVAFYIIKCVAEALHQLHIKDLCHGNVCPNNIFVRQDIIENNLSGSAETNLVELNDSGMHYLLKSNNKPQESKNRTIDEKDIHQLNEYQIIMRTQHIEFIAPELKDQLNPKEKNNIKNQPNQQQSAQKVNTNSFEPTPKSDIYQLGLCLLCMCNVRDIKNILKIFTCKQELQDNLILSKIDELELNQIKDKKKDIIKQLLKQMLQFDPSNRLTAEKVAQRADSIYTNLQKKPLNDKSGFFQYQDIEQYEMKEFTENFDDFLQYQRYQVVQKLQDVCKVALNKQKSKPRSELIRDALNVIDQYIKSTRNFTIDMLTKQCNQIQEKEEREQLINQINEFNLVNYYPYSNQQGEEGEKNKQLDQFEFTPNYNNEKQQVPIILSCIFLDPLNFITIDSNLELNLWNIDLKKPSISTQLADFNINSVKLLNLSVNKIIIHDEETIKIFNVLREQLSKAPRIYIEKSHDCQFNFKEYKINKVIPLNSDDNLFIVITMKSQFILCNANLKGHICSFSLMNIPKIQRYFESDIKNIPQAELLVSEYSSQQIMEQSQQYNSSIVSQHPYQYQQSQLQYQQPQNQQSQIQPIQKTSNNPNNSNLYNKFISLFRKSDATILSAEEEKKKQMIPDVPLVIIIAEKYLYHIKLRDLALKNFDKMSLQQFLPSSGKFVCGLFHPTNKHQIIFITDCRELVVYDYIANTSIIKLHFAESLFDLQYISFEKKYYLIIRDFNNLYISKLDREYPQNEQDLQKIRSGMIRQIIVFPRCLSQTQFSLKQSHRPQQ